VLVSNLGLTVFSKHQVNWLNRFCPQGKKKKQLKAKTSSLRFCPLPEQKPPDALALSLFIESRYASQDI
jgi:hypothetical protein